MTDIKIERHTTIIIPKALQEMLENLLGEVKYEINEDVEYFSNLCVDIAIKNYHSSCYDNTDIKYVDD